MTLVVDNLDLATAALALKADLDSPEFENQISIGAATIEENDVVDLSEKGDIPVGLGGSLGTGKTSFAKRNAWYEPEALAIDWEDGIHQIVQLANGANAITGLTHGEDGTTYQLMLLQPASGAAGTITITPTAPAVAGTPAGSLSTTNGKRNIVTLTYDATSAPSTPYWAICISPEL